MKHLLNMTKSLVICFSLTIAISLAFLNNFPALAQDGGGAFLDVKEGDSCFAQIPSQGIFFVGEWDFQGNDVVCVQHPTNPGTTPKDITICKIEVSPGNLKIGTATAAPVGCKG